MTTLRSRNRRRVTIAAAALPSALLFASRAADNTLRFGTTPVFLDDQIALLGRWQLYLEGALLRPVQFVQRGSYREIMDLLLADRIDVAWVCGFPYVVHQARLSLVVVPTYLSQPLYRSYLLVPATDTRTTHVRELSHRVFAYSDPQSNSGYLVPRVELIRAARNPDDFFSRAFFTFGHRKVVEAVQVGLAQAGSVDGYVWDTLQVQQPAAAAGVRVAWRSSPHGFPPVVARRSLPGAEVDAIARALIEMRQSDAGRLLLARLNLEGFERSEPRLFDSIRELVRVSAGGRA